MHLNAPFLSRSLPTECHEKLKAYAAAGHRIRWVAFPPAGGNSWSIVTDKTFYNRHVVQECHDKMTEFLKAGHKILCVAFPPAGGNSWSIVTDKTFYNRHVVQECHDKMTELHKAGTKLVSVAFPPQGGNRWTVVGDNAFFNRNVPAETHRVMRAMTGSGLGPLTAVAYHPDDGFVVVSRADALYANHEPLTAGGKSFSLDTLAKNIRSQLEGKGCKYALMVRHGQAIRTAANGPKRTATSPPEQDFTTFDRFNPASVAKVITAVALLQLVEQHGLTINEPIAKHLPSTWNIGPHVDTITIKELLNHTSGFSGGAKLYADLRTMVAAGIQLANKVPNYENCNYSLARIVVACFNGNDETAIDQGKATCDNFIRYTRQHIFDRLHLPDVEWKPESTAPTLFYPTPPGTSAGTTYGDSSLKPGSSGVHLSIAELSIFVDALTNSNILLPPTMRVQMEGNDMGWGKLWDVDFGWYHRKRGYYPGAENGGAELHSGIYKFSTGAQAVVLHNGSAEVDMPAAYNAAWA